jgi:serine/threonine protein kinase/Tol biopolymer transport system component
MGIPSGTNVGAYEVTGVIGHGGMGEVYRARDHRLERDVALKVLPAALSRDRDRLARFAREARTLAALSHPNIAIIYDLEEDGERRALVMELVEGATLADRVAQGALPVDEAIYVALQIADAVEAAHEQGIIHRDLKPANIKVRPDGTVKVLDFGLAKELLRADVLSAKAAETSTVTGVAPGDALRTSTLRPQVSSAGMILGTAAYMSPEQARGHNIDTRADIWAFGCVLYEMLTGRRAFAGETMTDVLAAVLNSEPDWSALPPTLPRSVNRLLRRCLVKNPKNRLRDIGDARLELRSASATDPLPLPSGRETPFRRGLLWFSAGAVAAAGILSIYVSSTGTGERFIEARSARVVVALPPGVTLALRPGSDLALAPDGRSLAYTARTSNGPVQLYLRTLDDYESVVIPGTDDASHPFFSPDGRWVGFFAGGQLKKVLVAGGGAPVTVADVRLPRGEAWTGDDAILVTPANTTPLSRVAAAGGTLQPFSTLLAGELSHRWPTVLPNGTVLFSVWNDTGWEPARIAAQRPGSNEHVVVVERGGGFPRYLADRAGGGGYLVYARAEGLMAAPFDEKTLTLTAQPVPVMDGIITNVMGGADFAVAADGTLAYVAGVSDGSDRELVWLTPDGRSTPALRAQIGSGYAVSPDGRLVARIPAAGPRSLWIEDLESGTSSRLSESADYFGAVFSRDGSRIASRRAADIFIQRIDRRGGEEQLTTSRRVATPGSFSPGDAELAYYEIDPVTLHDIWVIEIAKPGGVRPAARPFLKTTYSEASPRFSPDGRWIAYQSNESGRFEIYVRSYPDGESARQVSTEGGTEPVWPSGGTDLLYRGANGMLMAAAITLSPEFKVGKPRALFDASRYESSFGAAADGRRLLLMPIVANEQPPTQIHVVLNFLAELRARAW